MADGNNDIVQVFKEIENDIVTIIISDLETETMTFDKAVYTLKLKGNGIVKKLLVGTVTVSNGG